MELSEEYYEALGVTRNSSAEEIRKAYRKLALKWHPDKNLNNRDVAEMNFKRLAEAYEVLSDPKKKQMYDQFGKDGLTGGGGGGRPEADAFGFGFFPGGPGPDIFGSAFGGFGSPFGFSFRDPNDVFREFFGGHDPFSQFFEGASQFNSQSQGGQFNGQQQSQSSSSMFMNPFNILSNMGGIGGLGGMSSMSMQMSSNPGGSGANVKRISTSVKTVNGKRIETKRVVDNGVETVTVMENGQIVSQTTTEPKLRLQ